MLSNKEASSKECPSHETLVALWSGDIASASDEELALEEHLFACDACSVAFEHLARLVGGLRSVIPFVISHTHRDRMIACGTRIQSFPVEANVKGRALFAPELDLMVFTLKADLEGAESVDVDFLAPDGTLGAALVQVPFDSKRGEVLVACQRHFEGMFPGDPIFRVHANKSGERKHVGDYVVAHEWR